MRLQLAQYSLYAGKLFGSDLRSLVEENLVAELHLLYDEAGEVFLTDVVLCEVVASGKLVLEAQCVNDGDDGVEFGNAFSGEVGIDARIGADGLCDWSRLADAACFDDNIVEALLRHDVAELLYEIHLQCAADASVLKSHEIVVLLSHNATLLDECGVDVHFADVIDDDGELDALLIGKYTVEECCLSASKISGEQKHRCCVIIHNLLTFVYYEPMYCMAIL